MIEFPADMPKDQVDLMLAKSNHGNGIEYLLEKALDRLEKAQHYGDMPATEMDFLKDVEAKVKAAHDAIKDWTDKDDEG